MITRKLWDTATVGSVNLVDLCLVDDAFNKHIAQAAISAFDHYLNISFPAYSRNGTRSSGSNRMKTNTFEPKRFHSDIPTPNDFFFEYQRINGYTRGVENIKESVHVKILNDLIYKQTQMYLLLLGGKKASSVISLMEDGILSFDTWAAVQKGAGAYHKDHVHENVILSGVYYAAIPEGSAPLVLHKPQHIETRNDDDDVHIVSPREGQMVLFPPWLLHGVPISNVSHDKPRVSWAFNLSGPFIDPWGVTR